MQRLRAMIILCLIEFFVSICFSIISPFFPKEAEKKNVPQFWIGTIFGVFQGVQFIMSPILGLYMYQIGIKKLYLWGIFLDSISTLCFGFTTYIPMSANPAYFAGLTLMLRTLQGLGCSAYITASYVLTVHLYPDNIGTAFGIVETFAGLGFAIGPPIGGYLFMLGGYPLPFLVIGISLLILLIVAAHSIPSFEDAITARLATPIKCLPRPKSPTNCENRSNGHCLRGDQLLLNSSSRNIVDDLPDYFAKGIGRVEFINGDIIGNDHGGDSISKNKISLPSENHANGESAKFSDNGVGDDDLEEKNSVLLKALSFFSLFYMHYSISLDYLVMFGASLTLSFVDATLEPHLRSVSAFWGPQSNNPFTAEESTSFKVLTNGNSSKFHELFRPNHDLDPTYTAKNYPDMNRLTNATAVNRHDKHMLFLMFDEHPLNSAAVGSIFFVLSATYTVFALIFGALTDRKTMCGVRIQPFKMMRYGLIVSCLLSSIALLLSGIPVLEIAEGENPRHSYSFLYSLVYYFLSLPVPMHFDKTASLIALCTSQVVLGLAFALQIVMTFADITKRVSMAYYNAAAEGDTGLCEEYDEFYSSSLPEYLANGSKENLVVANGGGMRDRELNAKDADIKDYDPKKIEGGWGTARQNLPEKRAPNRNYSSDDGILNQNGEVYHRIIDSHDHVPCSKTHDYRHIGDDDIKFIIKPRSSEEANNDSLSTFGKSSVCPETTLISGLYSSAIAAGAFIGPVLAGIMTGRAARSYSWAADRIALFEIAICALATALTAYKVGDGTGF
ncbi:unnamed protein product [Gordionus sp. m RMFG-2023]|uniref:uncharacterized protein LOC135922712 isoform X2 n=1 Tax=Gordionus sp. m RMFG-2023 TaxID=3053472 RepID=UPI0030E1301A